MKDVDVRWWKHTQQALTDTKRPTSLSIPFLFPFRHLSTRFLSPFYLFSIS